MKIGSIWMWAAGAAGLLALAALATRNLWAAGAPAQDDSISHADARQALSLLVQTNVAVLDIRTPAEFNAGHIAGATNVDYYATDFAQRLGALDKSKTYLVHCASGRRSTVALKVFKKLQFPSVVHLDGGMNAWLRAGHPVRKENQKPSR